MRLYEDEDIFIEREPSEIPWVKIFTRTPYRELSDLPDPLRMKLYRVCDIVEREMIAFFNPDKINIASFGNQLPRVHIHVMARFENDSFFPEPMWGRKQREGCATFPAFPAFAASLAERLKEAL
ncbi:HIT family protein [Hydrogenimonas sp.]